jgi:hypothetical protein
MSSRYGGQFRPEFSRLYEDDDLYWVTPFFAPRVLGVVGSRFVGVSSVIDYLVNRYGYRAYTLGSELRRIAEERGVPISHRRYLQDLGDEIRTEAGDAGYLARRVLRRIRDDYLREPPWALPHSIVIGGIKTNEELAIFSSLHNFKPVEVQMRDTKLRYRRALKWGALEEEYEADRAREVLRERTSEQRPEWSALDEAGRRSYFDELDRIHAKGHPGNWPEEYKGAPAKVIAQLKDPIHVQNDFDSLSELHAEIDRKPLIRTAHQLGY